MISLWRIGCVEPHLLFKLRGTLDWCSRDQVTKVRKHKGVCVITHSHPPQVQTDQAEQPDCGGTFGGSAPCLD